MNTKILKEALQNNEQVKQFLAEKKLELDLSQLKPAGLNSLTNFINQKISEIYALATESELRKNLELCNNPFVKEVRDNYSENKEIQSKNWFINKTLQRWILQKNEKPQKNTLILAAVFLTGKPFSSQKIFKFIESFSTQPVKAPHYSLRNLFGLYKVFFVENENDLQYSYFYIAQQNAKIAVYYRTKRYEYEQKLFDFSFPIVTIVLYNGDYLITQYFKLSDGEMEILTGLISFMSKEEGRPNAISALWVKQDTTQTYASSLELPTPSQKAENTDADTILAHQYFSGISKKNIAINSLFKRNDIEKMLTSKQKNHFTQDEEDVFFSNSILPHLELQYYVSYHLSEGFTIRKGILEISKDRMYASFKNYYPNELKVFSAYKVNIRNYHHHIALDMHKNIDSPAYMLITINKSQENEWLIGTYSSIDNESLAPILGKLVFQHFPDKASAEAELLSKETNHEIFSTLAFSFIKVESEVFDNLNELREIKFSKNIKFFVGKYLSYKLSTDSKYLTESYIIINSNFTVQIKTSNNREYNGIAILSHEGKILHLLFDYLEQNRIFRIHMIMKANTLDKSLYGILCGIGSEDAPSGGKIIMEKAEIDFEEVPQKILISDNNNLDFLKKEYLQYFLGGSNCKGCGLSFVNRK